ncbi:MAG TPA: RNA chaperone Hfq [Tissierellaceae bacterium]|nr:RNA chaperone Hfq [Tissierellaceae bacterium]
MKQGVNLQDQFLNSARREGVLITVFLVNGYQIKGYVKGFDSYTIVLDADEKQQLVYKHAISTIIPNSVISFDH